MNVRFSNVLATPRNVFDWPVERTGSLSRPVENGATGRRWSPTSAWWSLYAACYDRLWHGPLSARLADAVVELAGQPGGWTIDVGAGTGLISERLATTGHRLVCVDSAQTMIRRLAARLPGAIPVVGALERLPLRRGMAQTVVATNILHLQRDPAVGLATLLDLVAPGGALICSWPAGQTTPRSIAARERAAGVGVATVVSRLVARWLFGTTASLFTGVRRASAESLDLAVHRAAGARRLTLRRINLVDAAQTIVVLRRAVT